MTQSSSHTRRDVIVVMCSLLSPQGESLKRRTNQAAKTYEGAPNPYRVYSGGLVPERRLLAGSCPRSFPLYAIVLTLQPETISFHDKE